MDKSRNKSEFLAFLLEKIIKQLNMYMYFSGLLSMKKCFSSTKNVVSSNIIRSEIVLYQKNNKFVCYLYAF